MSTNPQGGARSHEPVLDRKLMNQVLCNSPADNHSCWKFTRAPVASCLRKVVHTCGWCQTLVFDSESELDTSHVIGVCVTSTLPQRNLQLCLRWPPRILPCWRGDLYDSLAARVQNGKLQVLWGEQKLSCALYGLNTSPTATLLEPNHPF